MNKWFVSALFIGCFISLIGATTPEVIDNFLDNHVKDTLTSSPTAFTENFYCPLCETSVKEFIGNWNNSRPHASCPHCLCLERHRHLWLFFKTHYSEIFLKKITLLHWAPEEIFAKRFISFPNLTYIAADLFPAKKEWGIIRKLNITHIDLPDNSLDLVMCNHVLEHIPDDKKALSETMRVLKPGGHALFTVPLYYNLNKTYEDFSITDPNERLKAFDQRDHVRKYGWDILKRMEDAGFIVNIHLLKDLPEDQRRLYGLDSYDNDIQNNARRGADIILCKKPSELTTGNKTPLFSYRTLSIPHVTSFTFRWNKGVGCPSSTIVRFSLHYNRLNA
ncbi:methyltransferase domain-containing protein [Candidatus Dependentiae bacterium]|nr:methyltransferase domain-containing protein [Candidatus Dependentiae bacterium]